ncbi:MAG TPA: preprotein translocase subunit SecA [Candidatus Paceibacterota bacterium]|nr:preprotein translocase subunit SecA [Candidatus Pacearchaeota archaeon]HRZ50661.1 preprotein translocase subunit SecA [Candidatus Paceibacterota bacterium]HSA36442.1 preprotein translocase subunit SecA [Candidatus Paceibacterota bacterium]
MSILTRIFGETNAGYFKKLQPDVDSINAREKDYEGLADESLKDKTKEFKERLAKGETLDDIMPQAFALVRETAKRNLKQRHFDVQLMGGIILHKGKIAEMKTGEGKTLTATLPIYLNALDGLGCHLVTVNDYLARRDAVWMGQVYHALGLSTGCINHEQSFIYDPGYKKTDSATDLIRDRLGSFRVMEDYLRPCTRKEAYAADITYGTNNEFGFDYLRDNMAYSLEGRVQRGYHFAIVDEVDSILIDEARTPLIISAPDQESSKWYQDFARIMPRLSKEADYAVDEKMKAVTLTEEGIAKIEKILGVENIYEEKGIKYLHHMEQALRAQVMYKLDRDYVVRNNEIIIIDEFTGRLMPGRRWSGGLHQAVEAKEGVAVQPESLTLASITFQNYFKMYKKLSGMTGTAMTSAEEFDKVYRLDCVPIPTNKKLARVDIPDKVYKNEKSKFEAVVKEIKERNKIGQPVLVGTRSVDKNEYLGKLLELEGVRHEILNAKNHEREGEIIAQAGKMGAVTIATNMAGRGVDIILGGSPANEEEAKKVRDLGGLLIMGTERHEARRIDNQLRGRGGRQGDPGTTQFFISLEDDLLRIFGGEKMKSMMDALKIPDDQPIEHGFLSKAIEDAQTKIEGMNFDVRKHLLDYDSVLNKHREVIYKKRLDVLEKSDGDLRTLLMELSKKFNVSEEDFLNKEKEIGPAVMIQAGRYVFLKTVDHFWQEHLEEMEHVRDSVRLRAYGQQDPLIEYKNEGHKLFRQLLELVEGNVVQNLMKLSANTGQNRPQPAPEKKPVMPGGAEPNRNDPCPCGAKHPDGRPLKYKHCHGK